MKTTASYTMKTLPTLTKAERAKLRALAVKTDSEIDTSEIPEWTDAQWKNAVRGKFYRPNKKTDYGEGGCRCVGLVEVRGQGVSVAVECDSAAGDAG
jgi:hypothetical protein